MIILRSSGHGAMIRVCLGIFTNSHTLSRLSISLILRLDCQPRFTNTGYLRTVCFHYHDCVLICTLFKNDRFLRVNNLLLIEREGRTGEYWPEVVAVRTERSEVRTKTTEGQYSPVRFEQARLVSSLLYGTRSKLVYL